MKFSGIPVLLSAAILCSSVLADSDTAFRQEVVGYKKCMDMAESNTDIIECTAMATKHYDRKLNANYKAAMKNCETRREITGSSGVDLCKKKLREAERAWIRYRDLMAEYLYQVNLGSIDQINSAGFVAEETKKQADCLRVSGFDD